MPSLTSPFGLTERIRKPDTGLDFTALATVLATALLLTLVVGSRFVYAPGITVGLSANTPANIELPVAAAGSGRLPGVYTTDTVLALKQDDMVIWNGRIRSLDTLAKEFAASPVKPGETRGVLLVKADKSVSMQTFFEIVALARTAGYSGVQIAGEDAKK